jgi:hypothetical protein
VRISVVGTNGREATVCGACRLGTVKPARIGRMFHNIPHPRTRRDIVTIY